MSVTGSTFGLGGSSWGYQMATRTTRRSASNRSFGNGVHQSYIPIDTQEEDIGAVKPCAVSICIYIYIYIGNALAAFFCQRQFV